MKTEERRNWADLHSQSDQWAFRAKLLQALGHLNGAANGCPQMVSSHWKHGIELLRGNIFEIFILLFLLSLLPPCRAAKGSILCWKPRLAAPGLASLMALWGGLCEVRCEAQLWWSSAPGECRPAAGHRVEPVWSLPRGREELQPPEPFTWVQKCSPMCMGSGSSCRCAGAVGLHRNQGAGNITQDPLISAQFCFIAKTNKQKGSFGVMFVLCFQTSVWKKVLEGFILLLINKYTGGTQDLLALFCWNPAHQGARYKASVPPGHRCPDGTREIARCI